MLPGTFNVQLKCLLLFLQYFHKDILGRNRNVSNSQGQSNLILVNDHTIFPKTNLHSKFHDSRTYSKRNITETRFSIIEVKCQGKRQCDLILVDCTPTS